MAFFIQSGVLVAYIIDGEEVGALIYHEVFDELYWSPASGKSKEWNAGFEASKPLLVRDLGNLADPLAAVMLGDLLIERFQEALSYKLTVWNRDELASAKSGKTPLPEFSGPVKL